jgi:hypothetical protein
MQQIEVVSTTDSKEDVARAQGMYSKKAKVEEKSAPEAKEPEAKQVEASEAPKDDIEASPKIEEDDVDETEETEEFRDAEKPKKKGGFQKRIDKLTKSKTLAEQERDYWKEQALKSSNQKSADSDRNIVEAKADAAKDAKPDPERFNSQQEYIEALTDWKIEQKAKAAEMAQKVEAAKAQQEKTVSGFRERVKEFQKTATDLPEVLEAVDHIPLSPALQEIFIESERGHELMYTLAKNPAEYERIAKLPPLAAAKEMGKLEAKLASKSSDAEPEAKTTKAPPPIKPVTRANAVSTKDPGEMSYQEYKAWHKKQFGN